MKIGIRNYDGDLIPFEGSGHEVEVYVFLKRNGSSYKNLKEAPKNLSIILDNGEEWDSIYKFPSLLEYIEGFGFEENSKRFLDEFINELRNS